MHEPLTLTNATPTSTSERPPLEVRVIAGVMIVAGVHSLVGHVLNWWTEWNMSWNFNFVFIPLAWGLLRRREWARIVAEVISFSGAGLFALMVVVCFAVRDGGGLYYRSAESFWGRLGFWQGPIVCVVGAVVLFGVFCTLEFGPARSWFLSAGARDTWVVWNPLRWRFSVSAMLFLTALFAMAVFLVVYHPSGPNTRAKRWIARQDLNDPVYFPSGILYWTGADDGEGGITTDFANGEGIDIEWATLAPMSWNDEPTLVYVVFEEAVADYNRWVRWRVFPKDSRRTQNELQIRQHPTLTLPDDAQIVEIVDGKPRRSELRITVLELWSYLNSDALRDEKADRSLRSLETYVQDLRKRVAERDAARPASP